MKEKGTLIPKGFAGKIIKIFIVFAFAMGVTYLAVIMLQLSSLHKKLRADEETQRSIVTERSEESMTAITEQNLIALIKWAADRTDDEFWIVAHDLRILQGQVSYIFRNPGNFERRPVYPPRARNAGKPALQLISPDNEERYS